MHTDTIALLTDCTAGIRKTVCTIDHLLPAIRDRSLRHRLQECVQDCHLLQNHAKDLLDRYGAHEKAPGMLARQVIRIKAGTRMSMGGDDTTAAELVARDCDREVRALSRSLNRCCMASADAMTFSREVIRRQEALSAQLRPYL